MADMLYKFQIPAPTTVNKVKSQLMSLDKSQGPSFRIEKAWIQVKNRDGIATTDALGFQLTTVDRSEQSALLDITDKDEVYTWYKKETFTQDDRGLQFDPLVCIPIEGIEGTFLNCNDKNYLNGLSTGQDGADNTFEVKILGGYTSKEKDDWNNSQL